MLVTYALKSNYVWKMMENLILNFIEGKRFKITLNDFNRLKTTKKY